MIDKEDLSEFIRVKRRTCRDCGAMIPEGILEWLITHWVHLKHCAFCGQPVRIIVTPMHGQDGRFCWRIETEYPDSKEVHRDQYVNVVHDKCWNKTVRRKA